MNRYRTGAIRFPLFVTLALLFNPGLRSCATTVYVYNSFGPGNTYNSGVVWAVSGAAASSGYRGQAEFFVPSISGSLSTIQLAINILVERLAPLQLLPGAGQRQRRPGRHSGELDERAKRQWIADPQPHHPTPAPGRTGILARRQPAAANSFNGWFENNQKSGERFCL